MKKISLLLMLFMGLDVEIEGGRLEDGVCAEPNEARRFQRADEIWGKRTGKDHDRLYGRREQHYL